MIAIHPEKTIQNIYPNQQKQQSSIVNLLHFPQPIEKKIKPSIAFRTMARLPITEEIVMLTLRNI